MLNFSNPDNVLKILLSPDINYNEMLETAQDLVQDIEIPHINEMGNKYPSSLSQCILECYKIINNFHSNQWCSAKRLPASLIKPDKVPIKFLRKITNGDSVEYELYNFDQIYSEKLKNTKIQQNSADIIKNEQTIAKNNNLDKIKIQLSILRFIKDFNGMYGRGGIAKVLKGSHSIKENDFNLEAKNSVYFGLLEDCTKKYIIEVIDEFIESGVLYFSKGSFARPLINIKDDYDFEKLFNELPSSEPKKEKKEENEENDDENFKKIRTLLNEGSNIFITGHAGTGKSYILNKLKEKFPNIVITSTTGIAAVNVKGQTLHSWAGVGICNKPIEKTVENILRKSNIKRQIVKCKILAVDEISMLDIKTFEYVDAVLKEIRSNDKPFGGIQVIFIGDFYQLPPVTKQETEQEEMPKYCFESPLWQELDLKTVMLNKNYRQNEENLIKALADMRVNALTEEDIQLLKSRECYETDDLEDVLHIFATNYEADKYNNMKFQNISSRIYELNATDGIYRNGELYLTPSNEREENMFNRIDTVCTAEKTIALKIGVRVMLLTNIDFEKGLINGSTGNVEAIEENFIRVHFDNGITENIEKHNFEFYNNEIVVAVRKQYPLRLAYGITIHKSQGMSLDKLVVDCSKIFEKGQVYVALSRIKTLNGLYLHNFNPKKVMVDEKVSEFYKSLNRI